MAAPSPFVSLDRQAVLGTLEAAGSRDPDVLHAHMKRLVSAVRFPMLAGISLIVLGLLLTVAMRGAVLGVPLVGVGWWSWRRGARNVATVEEAYHAFLTSTNR